jgi:hypothetical protein
MKTFVAAASLIAAIVAPVAALATLTDVNYIPDGIYVVKVEKVNDAHHALVLMQNGIETVLVGKDNVDFSRVKPNDTIKISLIKGVVPVYAVQ